MILRNRNRRGGHELPAPGMYRPPAYSVSETTAMLSRALEILLKGPNIKQILATKCQDTIDLKAAANAVLAKSGKSAERLVVED